MSNLQLIIDDLDGAAIRKTETGKNSIYDVLTICGAKNPWETLKRMDAAYPDDDVLTKCEYFQFEGQGQRPTPVADKEHTLKIIGLCPGKIGKSYREFAAQSVRMRIENDPSLTREQLSRHDDQTAAAVISDRVDTMEDATAVRQVAERSIKRLSWLEGVDYVFTKNTSPKEFKRLENRAAALGVPSSNLKPVRIKTRAGMNALIEYARTDLGVESLGQDEMEALAASGVVRN